MIAHVLQLSKDADIPFLVVFELGEPEFTVSLRCSSFLAPRVSMPEATMYEEGVIGLGKPYVGTTWLAFNIRCERYPQGFQC